jgi:hypothetical protein
MQYDFVIYPPIIFISSRELTVAIALALFILFLHLAS